MFPRSCKTENMDTNMPKLNKYTEKIEINFAYFFIFLKTSQVILKNVNLFQTFD